MSVSVIINAFDITARQSFVVEMIENEKYFGNAIALNSSMVNGARIVGPVNYRNPDSLYGGRCLLSY